MSIIDIKRLFFFMLLSVIAPLPLVDALSPLEKIALVFKGRDKKYYTLLKEKYLSPNLAIPAGSIASRLTEYVNDIAQYVRIKGDKFSAEEQKNLIAIKSVLSTNFKSFLETMKTLVTDAEALARFKIEYLGKDMPGLFDASFFNAVLKTKLKQLSHPLEVLIHLATLIIAFPATTSLDVVKNVLKIRPFITSAIRDYGELILQTFFAAHTGMLFSSLVAQARSSISKKTSFLEKAWAVDQAIHLATMPIRIGYIPIQYKQLASYYF